MHIPRLQRMWQRFVTMGASDNDLHELVTLAQDMECDRIASLVDMVATKVPDSSAASLLRVLRDTLRARGHRPGGV